MRNYQQHTWMTQPSAHHCALPPLYKNRCVTTLYTKLAVTAVHAAQEVLKMYDADIAIIRIYSDKNLTLWPPIFELTYSMGWENAKIADPRPSKDIVQRAIEWNAFSEKSHLASTKNSREHSQAINTA